MKFQSLIKCLLLKNKDFFTSNIAFVLLMNVKCLQLLEFNINGNDKFHAIQARVEGNSLESLTAKTQLPGLQTYMYQISLQ